MNTRKIDGLIFARMLVNGMASLQAKEKELNAMNVFPVADGDTGTNMLTTLKNGIKLAPHTAALNEYLKAVSGGMLLGARGNSGVILSQIFKGISLELSKRTATTAMELRNAFIRGYKVAYEAVIHPTEGTILTVCREGIEQVTRQMRHIPDVETLLTSYLGAMEISLARTPDLLPVLAEMGVVDSGAKGFITLVQGMEDALEGRMHSMQPESSREPAAQDTVDYSAFNEASVFNEGYCMEFILQMLKSVPYLQNFSEKSFIEALEQWGSSLVVVRDGARVKVHIHTKKPAPIINYAQQFGEFLTFKLENMQLQHNEVIAGKDGPSPHPSSPASSEKLPIATIAAVNGSGMKEIFEGLGCNKIIECGPTMNTSTEEFLQAIRSVNASKTVILPGNPNLILAAQQAANMTGKRGIYVLDAKTIPESYFALAMDIQDSDDYDQRIDLMREGINNIETVLIATAAKSFSHNGISFPESKWVAICRNEPVLSAVSSAEAVIQGLEKVKDIGDREICVLIRGANGLKSDEEYIQSTLQRLYPMLECTFLDGGQQIYAWMIGLA